MKKILLAAIILIAGFMSSLAQDKSNDKITTDVDILVLDLDKVKNILDDFINKNGLVPIYLSSTNHRLDLILTLGKDAYVELDSLVNDLGYISSKRTTSMDFQEDIDKIETEIKLLRAEHKSYTSLISDVDTTADDRYFSYWEKVITLEKEISLKELELEELIKKHESYRYRLEIQEESNSTQEYQTAWVNMPGIEYSLLFIEQPEQGVSPERMNGVSLKYMFNTGKSYGVLGLYKSMDTDTISEIDETYIFAFGQDFYSKRMGRGQRKFFNLYTSMNIGVYVSTSEDQKIMSWFVNPFLGLEIFKNKYFLIDNKVGYFLPYKNNRTQRGLLYNASFNFVF